MAITLITGPANAGKAQLLLDGFCGHAARGEEPILVVPTQADVEHYSRELVLRGVLIGARVRRFQGLVEEIARRAGGMPRAVGEQTRRRILAALMRQAPADLSAERSRPGVLDALTRLLAQLEGEHVTPARLRSALGSWTSAQGHDSSDAHVDLLGHVYVRYIELLDRLDWADPERYTALALDTLRAHPGRWRATPVLFYGFDDLTVLQLDGIETLGVRVDAPVTVSLTYEPARIAFAGRSSAFQTLAPLAREHQALPARADHYQPSSRVALHHLERYLFERCPTSADPAGAVRLLEGGGERAELELVAEEIASLLERGISPEELAVVHRTPAKIAPLLSEVFRAAGIPYALQRPLRFANTAIGAGLLGLLRCALGNGQASDLLAWLRTPGLVQRLDLVDRLEARLRSTGESSAERARTLWEAENWRLESIETVRTAAQRGPLALIASVERELDWLLSAPHRRLAALLASEELDEARAVASAHRMLAELGELARAAGELAPTPAELIEFLEQLEFLGGDPPTPERVVVCGPLALRARRVRALILCGLQEGVFPAPPRSQAFLSTEQRRELSRSSGLHLGAVTDALAVERYLLYACVSRPLERLLLSWHSADDDGSPTAPSLFIEDICDLFDTSLRETRARRALGAGASHQPSDLAQQPQVLDRLTDSRLLAQLAEETVFSASALETWWRCPVRWFVERLLRAQDIDPDPEPLARGGLAHAVLHNVLDGLRAQTGSARLTSKTLSLALELLELALHEHEAQFPLSVAPERIPGLRRRLEADLERYLTHAAENESPLEPGYLELAFGFPQESELAELDLGEGIRLR
ncbi:MAG: PD-(D/E)XK nuclease family protein, partial [Solirubrobacteraceae bacterium]